jgi:hypothetical protein
MISAIRAETWEQINRTLLTSARATKLERGRPRVNWMVRTRFFAARPVARSPAWLEMKPNPARIWLATQRDTETASRDEVGHVPKISK